MPDTHYSPEGDLYIQWKAFPAYLSYQCMTVTFGLTWEHPPQSVALERWTTPWRQLVSSQRISGKMQSAAMSNPASDDTRMLVIWSKGSCT